jgi:hypothetical protein
MTNATRSTRLTVEHRFEVPDGGSMADLALARHWAEKEARQLGIDTSLDDWARVHVEDDQVVILVTEVRDGTARPSSASLDGVTVSLSHSETDRGQVLVQIDTEPMGRGPSEGLTVALNDGDLFRGDPEDPANPWNQMRTPGDAAASSSLAGRSASMSRAR